MITVSIQDPTEADVQAFPYKGGLSVSIRIYDADGQCVPIITNSVEAIDAILAAVRQARDCLDNAAILKAAAAKMVAEEPRTECDHAGILAERGM